MFRHAHSLKGDARAVGVTRIEEPARLLEDTLGSLREAPELVDQATIDRGLGELDGVRQAFAAWAKGTVQEQESPTDEKPVDQAPTADRKPGGDHTVRVSSEHLDRMLALAAELRISHRGGEDLAGRLADLREQIEQMPLAELRLTLDPGSRLEDRKSKIDNLVAAQSSLLDQVHHIESDLHQRHVQEKLLLASLETDIRQARLLPLALLTDSLRRAVRELGQSMQKSIQSEPDVGDILLDKAVIEALRDPLLHMIRNASGHGIESQDERRRVGKPDAGMLRIAASRRGDLVRITVSDDGGGVDFERIRERLRQQDKLAEAELAMLTEKELGRYLFEPGFTTKETEDSVSGRGVGLDVVLETVRRLHGNVELESSSPQGSTFAITVPVTVSTVRILTVSASDQWYGVPSSVIVRTGRARGNQLRELEGANILTIDGEPVRCLHLADLLQTEPMVTLPEDELWCYLLLELDGRRLAMAVDEVEDEAEVVLKPLGFPLRGLPGIVGATIRPDGAVQIVLDPSGLITRSRAIRHVASRKIATPARILVVDDSPATRAILRKVLSAAGYAVHTATDGVDALNRLRTRGVDLVVSDFAMPRMDGILLTREIKAKHHLPVVLVTSMESEEYQRQGLEAGADAYVVKSSFEGEGLLEIIRQLV
jgi:two-component system chemotaxis sensor kinase CheA